MGIYVNLKRRPFVSSRAHVRGRIAFASHSLEYLEGAFLPFAYTIWRNSTFKQSDGSIIEPRKELPYPITYSRIWEMLEDFAKSTQLEDLLSSIIVVEGKWTFDASEYLGYVSINNNSVWRDTYSDIEIEAYPKGDLEDITDLFWSRKETRNSLVNRFIEKLSAYKDTSVELTNITYSKGVPATSQDIGSLRALYYPQKRAFVKDMLTSYVNELKENKDTRILPRMKPFDVDFLITKLMSNEVFNEDLKNIMDSSKLIEIPAHSIAYVGQDSDSIKRTYKELSRTVFQEIARALPRDKEIADKITKALQPKEQTDFDNKRNLR
ncbi:MAG: hypothetical protein M1368_00065 [Thaumarchaeota archaeon]|nr:hypothetical protein [Nitrososphaerota archaeon]